MLSAGELLRNIRLGAGCSQRQVARRAGVAQPVIAAYESGRREPTLPQLRRLARAAGGKLAVRPSAPLSAKMLAARGDELVDVLLLADAYPASPPQPLRYPPLRRARP